MDWTTAYDNMAAVPGAAALRDSWEADSAAFAEGLAGRHRTLAYGPGPRNLVHVMMPEGAPLGLAVYIHGGYWMRNTPWVFLRFAAGALARGQAVAMPGYSLCPEVRISGIVAEIAAALARVAAEIEGPIRIAGHSAGGHLASRMLCPGTLAPAALDRVEGVLSISGIHDLRPIMATPMQQTLGLDLAEARAESPALSEPARDIPVTVWVGAKELQELRRQARLLAELWGGLGQRMRHVEDPGHDHFSVIEALTEPESPLTKAWLG